MIRFLLTLLAGILLGGVVHLVSVLALPRIATQDAYSRLVPMTKTNSVVALAIVVVSYPVFRLMRQPVPPPSADPYVSE